MYDITNPLHPANVALNLLDSHMGEGRESWVGPTTGVHSDWCAATMVAMGISAGLAGKCFPVKGQSTPSGFRSSIACAGGVCECIVKTYGGKRYDGPAWGGHFVPSKGDLIVFLWERNGFKQATLSAFNAGDKTRYWSGSHVGIVESVSKTQTGDPTKNPAKYTVHTIEGNSSNIIKRSTYSWDYGCIAFYARPDWSKSGGVMPYSVPTVGTAAAGSDGLNVYNETPTQSTYISEGVYSTQLYTTESSKADASVREVAYLGSEGKPITKSTSVRLAVINYTGLLSSIYRLGGNDPVVDGAEGGTPDNIDGLASIPRTIVTYLKQHGYNTAAAIGIIANIKQESDFRTSCVGDHGTSFGICQWHNARGTAMKNYVGTGWANNLSGQLDFLIHELNTSYPNLVSELKSVPNTLAGAKKAADRFVRVFERPGDVDNSSIRRQKNAETFWSQIATTSASESADYSSTPTVQKSPTMVPTYLVWPIESVTRGRYSSGFGYRGYVGVNGATTFHSGVDIGAKDGTPIKCCMAGKVHKNLRTGARGWVVIVDHGADKEGKTFYTLYQHMNAASPYKVGTNVSAGQVIGYVGNTGLSGMAPHLHLETLRGGELNGYVSGDKPNRFALNPENFFPKLGVS